MKNLGRLLTFLIIGGLVVFLAIQSLIFWGVIGTLYPGFITVPGQDRIAVISLTGFIDDIQPHINRIQQLEDRRDVKALLVDIDSPGGAVGPTQELSHALAGYRAKTGKPVISFIRNMGASGAYHVAVNSDTIVVNPGSIVGSIGVMIQFVRAHDLVEKIGVDYEVIRSGQFKDLGSPFRDMSDMDRELLQELVMDVYDQFIEHVAGARKQLGRQQLESLADGRIFSGRQALEKGLVDLLGGRADAIEVARQAAGLEDDVQLEEMRRRETSTVRFVGRILDFFESNLGSSDQGIRLLYKAPEWGSNTN